MFKKRNKTKKQDLNLASEDLKEDDNQNNDNDIIKKNKKFNKIQQDNKESENAIKAATSNQMDNMHFKADKDQLKDNSSNATIDLSEIQVRKQEIINQLKQQQNQQETTADGKKIYNGKGGYQNYRTKNQEQLQRDKLERVMGPVQNASNVRMTCNFDYNPEICKDYKERGECSFGDSCLYIHDRTDYKAGWEMENEWNEQKKNRSKNQGRIEEDSDEEDYYFQQQIEEQQVPKVCPICDEYFKEPVMTICKHYFCESCALSHYNSNPTCHECGSKTNGIFNDATKEIEKIRQARKKLYKERNEYRATVNKDAVQDEDTSDSEDQQPQSKPDSDNEDQDDDDNNKRKNEGDEDISQMENTLQTARNQIMRQKQKKSDFKQTQSDWNYH